MRAFRFLASVFSLPLLALLLALSAPLHAQTYYWDTDGSSVNGLQGGAGTWSTAPTDLYWSTSLAGSSPLVSWVNGNAAVFQTGSANTVTLDNGIIVSTLSQLGSGTATTLTGGNLQIDTGLTNSGDQLLTLSNLTLNAAAVTFATSATSNITVTGTISETGGARGLSKTALGTLTLNGANTYTGLTTVSGGVLEITNGSALGTASAGITVANGARLRLSGGITVTGEALAITANSDGTYLDSSGANTWTGAMNLSVNNNLRVNSSGGALRLEGALATTGTGLLVLQGGGGGEISGVISGTANLRIGTSNSGTWVISGMNTFTGQTIASAGTLSVSSILNNLGNPTGVNRVLGLGAATAVATLLYTGTGETTDRTISILADAAGGGGRITNNGTGALTLTGSVVVANSVTAGTRSLILNGINTQENTISGSITNNTEASTLANGSLAVVKDSVGTWVLSGTNSYKGATTVNAGILIVSNSAALGTTDAGTTVANAAILQLRGGIAITGEALELTGGGSGTGALVNASGANTWDGALTLNTGASHTRVGVAGGSLTLRGTINLNNAAGAMVLHGTNGIIDSVVSGVGGIIRSSADNGTWTLNGANTYTGDTTISRGTLLANNTTGSSTGAGSVNVNGTSSSAANIGVLGGTGTIVPGAGKRVNINQFGSLRAGNNTGDTTGTLTITGELFFATAGSALFEIGGKTAGDYDTVIVSGLTTLDGTITVNFSGSFTSAQAGWGDAWDLIDWGSVNSTNFDASSNTRLVLPTLTGGLVWDRSTFSLDGVIRVVPEPSRAMLLLAGFGCLALRRRRS